MARQLTKEALVAVQDNPQLFADVCEALRVKPVSLPRLITRNSERLTSREVTELIAKASGLRLSQIEETRPIAHNTAKV